MMDDFEKQIETAVDPIKILTEDFSQAVAAGDNASAKHILNIMADMLQKGKTITPVNAREYLMNEPPDPDQILVETSDTGDKTAIIGASKARKSFFTLQLALCLASGQDFLIWKNKRPRRVLLVQFELKESHYHKRVKNLSDALDISEDILDDNLKIINARGCGIIGASGIAELQVIANEVGAEVIILDPIYKLMEGSENSPESFKPILDAFDRLAEDTGAAIFYVHHDAKGAAGDRDIRDRGAGSNVLGRDYDACITLTPHRTEEEVIVVETLLRNYRSRPDFCIEWSDDPSFKSSCFVLCPDIEPIKMTSASKKKDNNSVLPISTYELSALDIVKNKPMPITVFRDNLRSRLKMTCNQAKTFTDWATAQDTGKLAIYVERGRGKNIKLIGLPDQINNLSANDDV